MQFSLVKLIHRNYCLYDNERKYGPLNHDIILFQLHIEVCGRILSTLEPVLHGVALPKWRFMQSTRGHRRWHTVLHLFMSCWFYRQPLRNPHRKRLWLLTLFQWCYMQSQVVTWVYVHVQHRIHRSVNNSSINISIYIFTIRNWNL